VFGSPRPQTATAGKSVWMVYLLGSKLGSLLRNANLYRTVRPLLSFTVESGGKTAPFPPFAICHPKFNDVSQNYHT